MKPEESSQGWTRRDLFLSGITSGVMLTLLGCRTENSQTQNTISLNQQVLQKVPDLLPTGTAGLVDEKLYQQRVDEYLIFATTEFDPTAPKNIAAHMLRSFRDAGYRWDASVVNEASLEKVFFTIDNWDDTRDFDLMHLLWIWYLDTKRADVKVFDSSIHHAIEKRFLKNRYRFDDPLPNGRIDNQWFWSENHRLIMLTLEHLTGQFFPNETFQVTGLTGAQQHGRATPEIFQWIKERARYGFFEWHSHVYMLKNVTPLLLLVELSDDQEVVAAATMALDLCLLDIASHLHKGCYVAPRGRTYKKDKMSSRDEDTFGLSKFLFGQTRMPYQRTDDEGPVYFCAASRYRPPNLFLEMASTRKEISVQERHGIAVSTQGQFTESPQAPEGYDFADPQNVPFWWSLGGLGMWQLAPASIDVANKHGLWDTKLFTEIKAIASLNNFDSKRLQRWMYERAPIVNFGFLGEAHTTMWKNKYVALATVVDHRPGEMRDQVHVWQASIDEDALVFTNHPRTDVVSSSNWDDDGKPGYWTGDACMPRSVQYKTTAMHLYVPGWDELTDPLLWGAFSYQPYTHAYVPQDHFETIVEFDNWVFMEKSDGYIGLWSWRKPSWREYDSQRTATRGMKKPFDLVANGGADNVWIVEVGDRENDGSFKTFYERLLKKIPNVVRDSTGFLVNWESPRSGDISFSTTGDFVVNHEIQELGSYPRHHSSWGTIKRGSMQYLLTSETSHWEIDFETMKRNLS